MKCDVVLPNGQLCGSEYHLRADHARLVGTSGYATATNSSAMLQQPSSGPLDDILNGVLNQPVTVTYAYNAQEAAIQTPVDAAPQQATMAPSAPAYQPPGIPMTAEQGIWGTAPAIPQTPYHFASSASWINPTLLWQNVRPPVMTMPSQGAAQSSGSASSDTDLASATPNYEELGIQLAQRQAIIETVEMHYGRRTTGVREPISVEQIHNEFPAITSFNHHRDNVIRNLQWEVDSADEGRRT